MFALLGSLGAQHDVPAPVAASDLSRHYANVVQELRAAVPALDTATAERRARLIDWLDEYRTLADFGRDLSESGRRNAFFVDGDGRRCAVGFLLDRSGGAELTNTIAARRNGAWIAELAAEPSLAEWLRANGLTLAEAARIQAPGGDPRPPNLPPTPIERPTPPEWTPDEDSRGDRRLDANAGTSGASNWQPRGAGQAGAAVAGATAAGRRGIAIADLQQTSWTTWWEWNRAHFTLPSHLRTVQKTASTTAVDPAKAAAERLLAELANVSSSTLRGAAAFALGRMGANPSVLAPLADDAVREVGLFALLGLGGSDSPMRTHELVSRLDGARSAELRSVAIAALAGPKHGPIQRLVDRTIGQRLTAGNPFDDVAASAIAGSSQPDLETRGQAIRMLENGESPLLRATGAELLGFDATREEIAALTKAVGARNTAVRQSAAMALGRSKHDLALPALQTAFELEHDLWTRGMLLLSIGDHGGAAAGDFLERELATGRKAQRAFAALALGLWGRSNDRVALPQAIQKALARDRNRDQRGAYLIALGLLRDPGSRELLTGELLDGSTSEARMAAVTALGMIADSKDLALLAKALVTDHCPAVRARAADAIVAFGTSAIDALEKAMQSDAEVGVRAAAAEALGAIESTRAAAALVKVAGDRSQAEEVRAGAAAGLGRQYRTRAAVLPGLRYQHNFTLLPGVLAWAMRQEL